MVSQIKEIEITRKLNELKLKESEITNYERKIETLGDIKKQTISIPKFNKPKTDNDHSNEAEIGDENILIEDMEELLDVSMSDDEDDIINTYQPIKVGNSIINKYYL